MGSRDAAHWSRRYDFGSSRLVSDCHVAAPLALKRMRWIGLTLIHNEPS
jgi:hypothetical protein